MGAQAAPLTHTEWLAERRTGIGSSDVPVLVLGEHYQKTPLDLWMDKRGLLPDDDLSDNLVIQTGHDLEPVAAMVYERETGRKLRVKPESIQHPQYPFMRSNIDREIEPVVEMPGPGIAELKAPMWATYWKWKAEGLSVAHVLQIQHQFACTGWQWGELVAYHPHQPLLRYQVVPDPELIALIEQRCVEFWACVESGELPPEPELPPEIMKPRPEVDGKFSDDPIWLATLKRWDRAKGLKADAEAELAMARANVEELMGDDQKVETPWGGVSWPWSKPSKKFNAKRFKAAKPEIHSRFMFDTAPSRRLSVKVKKEYKR